MVNKYKIVLIACCVALLCNFVAKNYFVNQQSQKIKILQKVVAAARSGRYIKSDKSFAHKQARENDLQKILKKIPEEFLFTEYAAEIRTLIDKNHLLIENSLVFIPGKVQKKDLINYTTGISVKGNYKKIKSLLGDFQNLPGLTYIDSVTMTRLKDDFGMIQLNLRLFVYFKRGNV